MKAENTLRLSALTGTAAKNINGSTTTNLFNLCLSNKESDRLKLQKKFEKVETIIIDEVSMIGCRHLLKIHTTLCKAKCVDPSIPFGGVDIIFFGDFMQLPPVLDCPLYNWWCEKNV